MELVTKENISERDVGIGNAHVEIAVCFFNNNQNLTQIEIIEAFALTTHKALETSAHAM